MHHIFVDEKFIDIDTCKITLNKDFDNENFRHLVKVLRVNIGEQIICSVIPFNYSFNYMAKISDINDDTITLDIIDKLKSNELPIKINLYQGITKSDKFEFIIEKAVELGVYSITPIENEFSVAKIDSKKISSKLDRYNKISKSAAEQSKRNIIPIVNEPMRYDDLIDKLNADNTVLFYENAENITKTKDYLKNINNEINIIIGPEGGFSDNEILKAKDSKIAILSLGDRILRTETAALTVLSIIMYELQR